MQQAVLDKFKDTGVVRWVDEVGGEEEAEIILSPEALARAIKASDRAVEEVKLERVGFVGVTSKDELEHAKQNRARQIVVYPDACPETEESRFKGRAMAKESRRGQRAQISKRGLLMVQPTFDVATGAVKFPKPAAPGAKPVKAVVDMVYVAIPKAIAARLAKLAVKDGFKANAETAKGKEVQTSKAVRVYILGAINTLLTKRAG